VTEALSRHDWYARWGKHYLLSLARCHQVRRVRRRLLARRLTDHCVQLEVCANFKDPGLQNYAGALFSKLQEIGDDAFSKLPPPQPAPPPPEGE
jgi:hypothetical protein